MYISLFVVEKNIIKIDSYKMIISLDMFQYKN